MDTITLVGLTNSRYKLLRKNLITIIGRLDELIDFKEINSIDYIITNKLTSIPAIFFNNRVLFEGDYNPNKEELGKLISYQITKPPTMKKILVPVDFSDTSLAAYKAADSLAQRFDASIDLVHVYDGTFNNNGPIAFELMGNREDTIMRQMKKFANLSPTEGGVAVAADVKCKAVLSYNTAMKLAKMSKDYDFVVMGMVGHHALERKLFGSIASYVAQHAKAPVLLIPRTHCFKGFKKAIYASNWESVNLIALNEVADLVGSYYGSIDFVHVREEHEWKEFAATEQQSLIEAIEEMNTAISYRLVNLQDVSPLKAIQNYAAQEHADLIILVNRQRGLLSNLFGKSMTKELALYSDVPLLIFHGKRDHEG